MAAPRARAVTAFAVLVVAAVAVPARGAPSLAPAGSAEVEWGTDLRVQGVADPGAPQVGAQVAIEVLAFPYDGAWQLATTTQADDAGRFSASIGLTRNSRLRAVTAAVGAGATPGPEIQAYVTPRPVASTVSLSGGWLVRELEYRLPSDVRGSVPTAWRAYGGPRSGSRLAAVGHGSVAVALRAGRYRFTRRVRVGGSQSWSGGFCEGLDFARLGFGRPAAQPACPTRSSVVRADLAARVPEVSVFSDSVGEALDYLPNPTAAVADGWSVVLDLKVCRRLVAAPCPPNPPSALQSIRSQPGSLGDIVVIDVGYNDWAQVYDIPQVMRALRARGVRRVVWVNLREAESGYGSINAMIRRAARRDPMIEVADWNGASAGQSWFAADGVHLSPRGGTALAAFLTTQVDTAIAAISEGLDRSGARGGPLRVPAHS